MNPPVTPHPSAEAVTLLQYLYSISGQRTLTGQHCVPLVGSTRLAGVHKLVNQYPALFGQDFGFSAPGTWDGINFRQQIALGEVGTPSTLDILRQQPRWTWLMLWGDPSSRWHEQSVFQALYDTARQRLRWQSCPG